MCSYPNADIDPDCASITTVDERETCRSQKGNPGSHNHAGEAQDGEGAEVALEFLRLAHTVHVDGISVGSGLDALAITQGTVTSIVRLVELDDFVLRHVCPREGEVGAGESTG